MPRRRYYRRYGRRRYGRRRRYRKFNFVNRSSRSRITVKIKKSSMFAFKIKGGQQTSEVYTFSPWIENLSTNAVVQHVLQASTLATDAFQNYVDLYDEVKVDSVYYRFTITTPIPAGGMNALRIYSAWDRKGLHDDVYNTANYPGPVQLLSSPSASCSIMSNNTVNTISRYCRASDFFEKYAFTDASCLTQNVDLYGVASNSIFNSGWVKASSSFMPFSPMLMIMLESVNFVPQQNTDVWCALEMTTYYDFRNPKFGSSSQSKDLAVKAAVLPIDDDEGPPPSAPMKRSRPGPSGYTPGAKRVVDVDPSPEQPAIEIEDPVLCVNDAPGNPPPPKVDILGTAKKMYDAVSTPLSATAKFVKEHPIATGVAAGMAVVNYGLHRVQGALNREQEVAEQRAIDMDPVLRVFGNHEDF